MAQCHMEDYFIQQYKVKSSSLHGPTVHTTYHEELIPPRVQLGNQLQAGSQRQPTLHP